MPVDPYNGDGAGSVAQLASVAQLIAARRDAIIVSFLDRLRHIESPLLDDSAVERQLAMEANQIIDYVLVSLSRSARCEQVCVSQLSVEIGATRAQRSLHPTESLRAASALFQAFLAVAAEELGQRESAMEDLAAVVAALDVGITRRIRDGASAYAGFLLERMHEAHLDERHLVARDLHDRVGYWASAAYRYLELYEILKNSDPVRASRAVDRAVQASREGLESIHELISGLRQEVPLESLKEAIWGFLAEAKDSGIQAAVHVNGDESWVPAGLRDEVFLVIREALRNAVTHAAATTIVARLDIAPHELRGCIDDDGIGIDIDSRTRTGGRSGLAVMNERASLLGGSLVVRRKPAGGTAVDLVVPLPGGAGSQTAC
jgi:signal transduction histidine kinase